MSNSVGRLLLLLTLLVTACSNKLNGNGGGDGSGDTATNIGDTGDTGDTGIVDPDNDHDGYPASEDCDDNDPNTYPGAPEICDGKDNNCDGVIPSDETDLDGDGVIECMDACGPAPAQGTVPTLPNCTFTPSPSGTPFAATVEWAMTQEMTDPTTGADIPAYTFSDYPAYVNVWQAPVVGELTDDNFDGVVDDHDTPDIAVIMSDSHLLPVNNVPDQSGTESEGGVLRIISGDGSKVWASAHYLSYQGTMYAPYKHAGLAIGDIDNDGKVEIPTLLVKQGTGDLDNDGLIDNGEVSAQCYPGSFEVDQTNGTVSLSIDHVYPYAFVCSAHAPAISDLNHDGVPDVIYGRNWMNGETWAHEAGGYFGKGWWGTSQYGSGAYWNSGYHPVAYDLDADRNNDHVMEVVAGNSVYKGDGNDSSFTPISNWLYCLLADPDGNGGWKPARDGYAAVADLVGDDGVPEIALTGNEYIGIYDSRPVTETVPDTFDYNGNGSTTDTFTVPVCKQIAQLPNKPDTNLEPDLVGMPANPICDTSAKAFGGPPTIADIDGDHTLEIADAGACYYSIFHFDPLDGKFKRYAIVPTKDWSSASTGSTVFDFNGDGGAEIVFEDERALYVWQFNDTATTPWTRLREALRDDNHKSWTIHEYPLVADVDGDGKAEIVVTNSYIPPDYPGVYGIYVLKAANDDWVSARKVWSQHTYYINNSREDLQVKYAAPNLDSFREQEPGSFGDVAAPNLYITAQPPCQDGGCGDITVYVQVANEGSYITAGTGVVVSIYGVYSNGARDLLDHQNLPAPVQPGEITAGIGFHISGWSVYDHLVAVVDDPALGGSGSGWGAAHECDETDNEVDIPLTGICP